MEEVLDFISKNTDLNPNDYVVIGLSGGPDSMALLNMLILYRESIPFNIVCAHVHHNIRKESDSEAKFVEEYCQKNNIIFEMTKFSYEDKFTESLGHKMRYEYFDKIVKKYSAKYLFTAHHGDDLVETILMRLVRGSSLSGYAGFDSVVNRGSYSIIRPLITVTKDKIMEYLESNNIPYVVDQSNFDTTYTRNRYRKYILPKLKDENPLVHQKFLEFSNLLNEYDKFVTEEVDNKYLEVIENNGINLDRLKSNNIFIVKNIIYKWLKEFYKDSIVLINKKHIDNIISIIYSDKPNVTINIPNYELIKEYNMLSIKISKNIEDYNYVIEDEVILPNGNKIIKVDNSVLTSNYVTHIDSSNILLPLYVRNVKPGDVMSIKNMKGHKKIKDIFINEKINMTDRIGYPVVVDSNDEIIWLPGIKKSSFDGKKEGKYDIILEYH